MNRLPDLTKEELLGAIRDGVYEAMWQMITNATSMPCNDFYDTVKAGIAEGIAAAAERVAHDA